jgi:hypothetical protein
VAALLLLQLSTQASSAPGPWWTELFGNEGYCSFPSYASCAMNKISFFCLQKRFDSADWVMKQREATNVPNTDSQDM